MYFYFDHVIGEIILRDVRQYAVLGQILDHGFSCVRMTSLKSFGYRLKADLCCGGSRAMRAAGLLLGALGLVWP